MPSRRRKPKPPCKRATDGLGVDVVLEMSGVPSAIHQAFALVRVGGRVQMLGIPAKPMEVDFATEIIFKGITVYGVVGRRMYDTWIQMTQFLRSGQFDPTPVITHRFPLEQFDDAIAAIKCGRRRQSDFRDRLTQLGDRPPDIRMTLNTTFTAEPRRSIEQLQDRQASTSSSTISTRRSRRACRWRGAARC